MTEGIIITTLRIPQSTHFLKSLLDIGNPSEVVTQEMIVQAVISKYSNKETIELLQSRGGQMTAELIVISARSINFTADVLTESVIRGRGRVIRKTSAKNQNCPRGYLGIPGTPGAPDTLLGLGGPLDIPADLGG